MLLSLGCTIGQGYFFARPMPGADADVLMTGEIGVMSPLLRGQP